ncbi:hypothetical protein NKCBBBOE_01716 [Pseudarthrobacter sp. MM222]|nr:hypothetical protein NKCBBBOE_01716 [Pseudarthrobacter sp. MM222]
MKANTVLILAAASILLTGSAAVAVNTQTLNSTPVGSSVPANIAILTQSETTAGSASPASTPSPSASEDAVPGSSSQPATGAGTGPSSGRPAPAVPSLADDRTAASLASAAPEPSRSIEANDDHGGHGEPEPGDDKHSGNDDDRGRSGGHGEPEPGDDKHSGNDD